MKHLISCIAIIFLGLLARVAGALALLALPSMASADGVAVRPDPLEIIARLAFIALPYLLLAGTLAVSFRHKRFAPGLAYSAAAALVLLPALALLAMSFLGISIIDAAVFWDLFPLLHAAAVPASFLYLHRRTA